MTGFDVVTASRRRAGAAGEADGRLGRARRDCCGAPVRPVRTGLRDAGLAVDARGFVATDSRCCSSVSHPDALRHRRHRHAARHPQRQGRRARGAPGAGAAPQPPCADAARSSRCASYRPQRDFPEPDGDRWLGIGDRQPRAADGRPRDEALWRWKDRIDRRFMATASSTFPPMRPSTLPASLPDALRTRAHGQGQARERPGRPAPARGVPVERLA